MAKKTKGYRLEEDVTDKIDYIAWHDRETMTSIVETALVKVIKDWEKKNGPITEELLRKTKK